MITLYQFPPLLGLPNLSHFCLKLETYLRMTNLPFKIRPVNNPAKSPKGKFPYIKDEDVIIADSSIIIDYLATKYNITLDQHLSNEQKAQSLAVQCLLEDHLYWVLVYSRWIDPQGWAITQDVFFANLPSYIRWFIKTMARKNIQKQLHSQGMGRHSEEEIYRFGKADITAIATLLGSNNFFFGDKPSSIDACLYGFLANIILVPIESPLKKHAQQFDNLRQYCERIKQQYY